MNAPASAGDAGHELALWIRKIPWRRAWQPPSIFLPGKSLGQRSLVGYSPWGCKESGITEGLSVCACAHAHALISEQMTYLRAHTK